MNENLDLTKILEGCPRGTEFYSSTYGTVTFIRVRSDKYYPIELAYYPKGYAACVTTYITKDGREKFNCNGECTFFLQEPKETGQSLRGSGISQRLKSLM